MVPGIFLKVQGYKRVPFLAYKQCSLRDIGALTFEACCASCCAPGAAGPPALVTRGAPGAPTRHRGLWALIPSPVDPLC